MRLDSSVVRLGDHVDSCLGKMLDANKNKGELEPYLGNSNVRWGTFDLTDLSEMRFEQHEEARYGLLPGDLIVCEGGEPGRCAIWEGQAPKMKIQKALHRIRVKPTLNNYYLYYWFCHAAKSGLLEPYFTGTTIKHLTGKAIAELKIPLPDIDVQIKMVDVLRRMDECIESLRATNTTLEAIAQAIFKSWFIDFDPVKAKSEGRIPDGIDDTTAALFPDSFEESALGAIPKGWIAGTLADVAYLNAESWTAKRHPEKVIYIDLANAKNNELASLIEYEFDEAPSRARRVLRHGDTIVGTVRPGNRSFAFIDEPADNLTASTGFAVLRPKSDAYREFVFLAATNDASIDHLAHVADGGAYPAVRPDVVAALQAALPPAHLVQHFHELCAPMLAAVAANQREAQTLAELRDTLLPRLISGKLKLLELQEVAEAL